jgi:hypothetical protein
MKPFAHLFDNKTKIKSSFILFRNSYIKNKDSYSLKQRRKIEKYLKKLEVLL